MWGMTLSPDERRARNAARERSRRAVKGDEINATERARRAADPERIRAAERVRYAAKAERNREWQRAYRAANADKVNAQVRARRSADPEHARAVGRAYYAANRDKINARNREIRDRAKDRDAQLRRTHGMRRDEWTRLWAAQDGRCYLCRDELQPDVPHAVTIDHVHSCCGPRRSCRACRRGLACANCNAAVGQALDDPGRLRRIADNLEVANAAAHARMSTVSGQPVLFE